MLVFKYSIFSIFSIWVNLFFQRFFFNLNFENQTEQYICALIAGTIGGLVTKYYLDKIYIFRDFRRSFTIGEMLFLRYAFNGIFTTLIFWISETAFWLAFESDRAREIGAIIGLSIGYVAKYYLDKNYVFRK